MRLALAAAREGEGLTRPNPPVGALVVKGGQIIGRGWHHGAGLPHAEVLALREAGTQAKGATLYVTLEPCCTFGRTPPCTDLIREKKVRRVVVASLDPNPRHAGRGFEILSEARIAVTVGVCQAEGDALLAPFSRWITSGMPYVTLKLGMTLDGRIADETGKSRWIPGALSRAMVKNIRGRVDAILVGGRTALLDDPELLPHPASGRSPYRVVVDSHGALPLKARLLNDALADHTLLFVTPACPAAKVKAYRRKGADVVVLKAHDGRPRIRQVLHTLGKRGLLHVLCEGGGILAGELVRSSLVNHYLMFMAPRLLGGRATPAIGGAGWRINRMPGLQFVQTVRFGEDMMLRAVPQGSEWPAWM